MNAHEPLSSRQRSDRLMQHLDAVAQNPDYLNTPARSVSRDENNSMEKKVPTTQADYYFGYGIGPNNLPSLEAVKTWLDSSERRFDTFTIAEYGMWDEAQTDESELENALKTQGLEAALNQAERMAVAGGYLDPNRDDPRVFFEVDAPSDPFITERERVMEQIMPQEDQQSLEYSVDAIAANGASRLDVTKSWGEEDHEYERLLIPQPDWETARANAETAHDLLDKGDLQAAMMLVELAGVEARVINPDRDDPRLFTQGPPDPFTTIRDYELSISEMATEPDTPMMVREQADGLTLDREANATLEGTEWFEATFEQTPTELLQPVNDSVNYAVVVQGADPWTEELAVEKYWREPGGYLGMQSVTLNTYDSDDEYAHEQAEQARDGLLEVYDERGLEAMMHKAELMGMQNGWLDGNRADTRLFTQGPSDRFETLAQQLEGEINPYWNTEGESIEDSVPPAVENPYWRLDTLPVNDLDGQSLGHALQMVVYPGIEHDPEAASIPALTQDEPFKMLEMAHFETIDAAEKFGKEFNSYLMPGVLDGPELAEEVARLERLPVDWKTLEGDDFKAYQNDGMTLIRDPSDWHLYNPNAEQDARIEAEGLSTNPTQPLDKPDEAGITPTTPELDF
ncbi:MAG: hypothetical protein GC179_29080 [Anaerolineaceae bacterium]|nr:hypothetical protein [Anaerolineaceae bacterium]